MLRRMNDPVTTSSATNGASSYRAWRALRRWFDADSGEAENATSDAIDWLRIAPFVALHLACIGVFWVGFSPIALTVAVLLYAVRMFAITGFYHRYFSHKAFRPARAKIGRASCRERVCPFV